MPTNRDRSGSGISSGFGVVLGVLLALASAAAPQFDTSPPPPGIQTPTPSSTAPGPSPSADVETLLSKLKVAPEGSRQGYDRLKAFGRFIDANRDGCDTRQEVLIAESLVPVTKEPRCRVTSGQWVSLYDATTFTTPERLDIDHVVPLAEAWDSGASGWDADRRRDYANDLDHPQALIAVSRSSNRQKGDRDPAEWKPSREDYWCQYAKDWVTVKYVWALTADQAEVSALRDMLATC